MNREGMVMLWMTQYLILVIMSAKERSPVFPDMLSSKYYCKVNQGGIDPMKDRDQEMENY
uniref:ORF59a n=1 Tax=Pinus koraiensis TaxID=88728 RepID=A4QM27_PINKO|nr:ORF59a [Pinus koraiensis]ABP35354.1 ORF59a [Pinus koraiensis]